ncbi:MAG TPA: signal peptidase I [Nitrososphaeraceae archaeon]|nr:signal peptidase I [Nitrososphaeraceae archaeon]
MSIVTKRQTLIPFTIAALTVYTTLFIPAYGQASNSTSIADELSINPPIIRHNSLYVVQSDTMLPILRKGDIVGVENHTSFNQLKIGDIIAFKSPGVREDTGQPEIIVHRIKQIYATPQGETMLRTKGDANPNSINLIDYPVKSDNYIGKVRFVTTKEDMVLLQKHYDKEYFTVSFIRFVFKCL